MSRAEQYQHLAAEVRARAEQEESPILKAEWENLAETYVRLAEQSGAPSGGATYDPIQELLDRAAPTKKTKRCGRGWRKGVEGVSAVLAGLVPAIHVLPSRSARRRGCAGQARA